MDEKLINLFQLIVVLVTIYIAGTAFACFIGGVDLPDSHDAYQAD